MIKIIKFYNRKVLSFTTTFKMSMFNLKNFIIKNSLFKNVAVKHNLLL